VNQGDSPDPRTPVCAALGPADYARLCVEAYAAEREPPRPPDDPLYGRVAACFCSIKKHGGLRGCIGTLEPAEPSLADEIARNAWSAAFRDPRFPPVRPDELDDLTYSVDVLSPSEPCRVDDLDPARYGVIVRSGWRRGVLLPDLSGVDTAEVQVAIALEKAGIAPDEPYDLRRFTVARYGQAGCDTACG
jgi:AmmeMemoRadiSam system protein A